MKNLFLKYKRSSKSKGKYNKSIFFKKLWICYTVLTASTAKANPNPQSSGFLLSQDREFEKVLASLKYPLGFDISPESSIRSSIKSSSKASTGSSIRQNLEIDSPQAVETSSKASTKSSERPFSLKSGEMSIYGGQEGSDTNSNIFSLKSGEMSIYGGEEGSDTKSNIFKSTPSVKSEEFNVDGKDILGSLEWKVFAKTMLPKLITNKFPHFVAGSLYNDVFHTFLELMEEKKTDLYKPIGEVADRALLSKLFALFPFIDVYASVEPTCLEFLMHCKTILTWNPVWRGSIETDIDQYSNFLRYYYDIIEYSEYTPKKLAEAHKIQLFDDRGIVGETYKYLEETCDLDFWNFFENYGGSTKELFGHKVHFLNVSIESSNLKKKNQKLLVSYFEHKKIKPESVDFVKDKNYSIHRTPKPEYSSGERPIMAEWKQYWG